MSERLAGVHDGEVGNRLSHRQVVLAPLLAKEGKGEITMVWSGRSETSTVVVCRHFEQ